ncbi:MAG: NAD(P)/FAD-dependent oxidoreductase [Alphaproteobacteria bacterium]|nr:NAD(P)/FAD-dependent oxidoreductase [Alphaproteobacteria bacterium]
MTPAGPRSDPRPLDVAVIGAGVVGCAVFREFAIAGARCALIERDADLLAGASKGNSAILHTGFDATPGTLEARCVGDGYRRYREIHAKLNLPVLDTGAVVVAWTAQEEAALPAIVARAHENGVRDVRLMGAAELRVREPRLAADARAAVLVPGEAIIDPWSAPLAYALQGLAHGGTVHRNTLVKGGTRTPEGWKLATDAGVIHARVVVNCAGNFGDHVEAIARPSPFRIRPRKGQFVVFDKSASAIASSIVLPVPTERTKGVVVCRTIFGNLIVGPTAEDQDDRTAATVDQAALRALIDTGTRILPALADHPVTATYAGLRPATEHKDYQIEALPSANWITVAGIRSTGLTGSLGIAAHVRDLHEEHFGRFDPPATIIWTPVDNLAEHRPRGHMACDRSRIVCHCELVTEREIAAAFEGPLPVASLGGLKRRTRCMMGRCQGFYCTRRVMEIASGRCGDLVEHIA